MRIALLFAALLTLGCGGNGNTYVAGNAGTNGSGGSSNGGSTNMTQGGLGGGGTSSAAGTGGSTAGTGGGGMLDESLCATYCAHIGECGGNATTCLTNCQAVDQVFTGACLQKQYAELACVGMLDCTAVLSYANDKLADPTCGAVYADFATTCLRDGNTPPVACDDFCQAAYACASDLAVEPPGCAQNCNEVLTGYDIVGGAACADAFEQVFGCYAGIDCVAMRALLEDQTAPAECNSPALMAADACGL